MTVATTLRSVRRPRACPAAALVFLGVLLVTGCSSAGHQPAPALHTSPVATAAAGTSTPAPSPTPTGPLSQRAEVPLPVAREETAAAATGDTLMVAGGFDTAGRDRAEGFL